MSLLFVSRHISVRTRASVLVYMTLRLVGVQFVRLVVLNCRSKFPGLLSLSQYIPTTLSYSSLALAYGVGSCCYW